MAKKLGKTTIERDWLQGKLHSSVLLKNKKELVENGLRELSMIRQFELIGISRSSCYYESVPCSDQDITIMHKIDEICTNTSFYGYRRIHMQFKEHGFNIGINRVLKYMNVLGI